MDSPFSSLFPRRSWSNWCLLAVILIISMIYLLSQKPVEEPFFNRQQLSETLIPQMLCTNQQRLRQHASLSPVTLIPWLEEAAYLSSLNRRVWEFDETNYRNETGHTTNLKDLSVLLSDIFPDRPPPGGIAEVKTLIAELRANQQTDCLRHAADESFAEFVLARQTSLLASSLPDQLNQPRLVASFDEPLNTGWLHRAIPEILAWQNRISLFIEGGTTGQNQPLACQQIAELVEMTHRNLTRASAMDGLEQVFNQTVLLCEEALIKAAETASLSGFQLFDIEPATNRVSWSDPSWDFFMVIRLLGEQGFLTEPSETDEFIPETFYGWDKAALDVSIQQIVEYQKFTHSLSNTSLPTQSKNRLQQLVQQQFSRQIELWIIQAMISEDYSGQTGLFETGEAQLRNQVQNLQAGQDSLLRLSRLLEKTGLQAPQSKLINLASNHANRLLEQVDFLAKEQLALTPLNPFNTQAGHFLSALYGIQSEMDADDFLADRTKRLEHISLSYAEPLVTYLLNLHSADSTQQNQTIHLWSNTIHDLRAHLHGHPSTDISSLHRFVTQVLTEMTPQNCKARLSLWLKRDVKSNVPAMILSDMVKQAVIYCEE